MTNYDVIIIGAGPGGIFAALKLITNSNLKIAIFDKGKSIEKRKCPINKEHPNCLHCSSCSIMSGFGGAGGFSDGKYNITTEFGGTLGEVIGDDLAFSYMEEAIDINNLFLDKETNYYHTDEELSKLCLINKMRLLNSKVYHFGTDGNYTILQKMYDFLKGKVDFYFETEVLTINKTSEDFYISTEKDTYISKYCIVATGRSGSKWTEELCNKFAISTKSNTVDIGVRVELPAKVFENITDKVYESKIVYRTETYQDKVRTFCMNPNGEVVTENTNGIITVNGHSYEGSNEKTENTNFALLVNKGFTEPFNDSNAYIESIAKLSNMLGGGVIVQRFGDLIRGQRSTSKRIAEGFTRPTLQATPGDLSLVLPKRILDDIIEMIYALDKVAPGTANDDTLLYGVEVKFYNMKVEVNNNLETKIDNLYIIGDCSGITHSLSQASASGLCVADNILFNISENIIK